MIVVAAGLGAGAYRLFTRQAKLPLPSHELADQPTPEAHEIATSANMDDASRGASAGAAAGARGTLPDVVLDAPTAPDAPEQADEDLAMTDPETGLNLESADETAIGPNAEVEAGLAYLDEIRTIPGASPLLDDILQYLQTQESPDQFGVENLPVDEHGLALLDEGTTEKMIKDPQIRQKWDKLTELIAGAAKEKAAKGLGAGAEPELGTEATP